MSTRHDLEEADELWVKADELCDAGHNEEAFRILLALAREGHRNSQNSAGFYLDHGIGVEKNPEEAMKWYRKAAKNGDAVGASNLGLCYLERNNLPRARFWLKRALQQGHISNSFHLGKIYSRSPLKSSQRLAIEFLEMYIGWEWAFPDEKKEARKIIRSLRKKGL